MLDFDFSVEHVLMFMIAIFLLYHLVNNCGCIKDGFSVGGMVYEGVSKGGALDENVCNIIGTDKEIRQCEYHFFKSLKDNTLKKCKISGKYSLCNTVDADEICDGNNCPKCDAFIEKNMNLKFKDDGTFNTPMDCGNIHNTIECEKKYLELWQNKASDITWDNGKFVGNNFYNKGDLSWDHDDNKTRYIKDICDTPSEAQELTRTINKRCNDDLEELFSDIDKYDINASDSKLIQDVKNTIKDANKIYSNSCCGSHVKCSPSQLSKIQENYLKKIASDKYCPTLNNGKGCNEYHFCNGIYNSSGNNGSGFLSAECECKLAYQLSGGKCGPVTCKGKGLGDPKPNMLCLNGQKCVLDQTDPTGMPGFGDYKCVKD